MLAFGFAQRANSHIGRRRSRLGQCSGMTPEAGTSRRASEPR
jgi:hypothetical protein